uniref:Sm domain-containing protein n=1 Tax=Parascaris univalens TaxID=6257 RepID=A0A914ZIX3_PARUN
MAEVEVSERTDGVYRWLGKELRLELTDGRIIEGKFVCTDNVPNVILSGCKENWKGQNEVRIVGLAMVTGKHIKSVHLISS